MSFLRKIMFLWPLSFSWTAGAGEPEEEKADLRLNLPAGRALRYAWTIESQTQAKGKEGPKPVEWITGRQIRMTVVLRGEDPGKTGQIRAVMQFEDLDFHETRSSGKETQTQLKITPQNIQLQENGKWIIDSANDIGLDKITGFQRNLRGMERAAARLFFEPSGKKTRMEGDSILLDTLQSGTNPTLFPILAGRPAAPGESWDDACSLPRMGDLVLDDPARVLTRVRLKGWTKKDGKDLAELEIVSAWEPHDLRGKDQGGLAATITRLEGLGTGTCRFDPAHGRFLDGQMEFNLSYAIQGEKKDGRADLEIKGKSRFAFQLKAANAD